MSNEDNDELNNEKESIQLEESENEEQNEIEDTFSQNEENNNIEEEDKNESLELREEKDDNNEEEEENNDISEENILKDEIEKVDFKSLLKVKAKLSYENSKNNNKNNDTKKKLNKNTIKSNLEKINKNKKKLEPKEFSALIRPKYEKENKNIFQKNSSLLHKKFSRDPRFDDLSGNLNEEKFKQNFGFVNKMAQDYINKLNKVKKSKKYKKKLTSQQYELLKKQNNYVKSWMNQQKQKNERNEIKKEINKENKERISKGLKPIYVNQTKLNKYFKNKNKDKENKK